MLVKSVLAVVMAALVGSVTAAERAAHIERMDTAAEAQLDAQDAFTAKSGPMATAAADKLIAMLVAEKPYWDKADIAEASAILATTLGHAQAMRTAATAGDLAAAQASFEAMSTACSACHDQKFDDKTPVKG
jgi:hypothetical protein